MLRQLPDMRGACWKSSIRILKRRTDDLVSLLCLRILKVRLRAYRQGLTCAAKSRADGQYKYTLERERPASELHTYIYIYIYICVCVYMDSTLNPTLWYVRVHLFGVA